MNKVILTGNIVRDFELMKTATGQSVVKNSVAVKRDYKNKNGEYDTDFIDFVAYGTTADYLATYGRKGDRIELIGSYQKRTYTKKDGATAYVHEVIVENASTFSNKPKEEAKPYLDDLVKEEEQQPTEFDDLPF